MAKVRGAVVVDTERCKGCNLCVIECPTNTLALSPNVNGKGYNYTGMVNPESCIGCANCAMVCPDSVLTVYKVKLQQT